MKGSNYYLNLFAENIFVHQEGVYECEDTRATHGTVSVYMGVFSHV